MKLDDIEDEFHEDLPLIGKLIREAASKTETPEQAAARRVSERKQEIRELMTGDRTLYIIPNLQEMVLGGLTMGQGVIDDGKTWVSKDDQERRDSAPRPEPVDRLDALWCILADKTYDERGADTPIDARGRTALFYVLDPDRVFGRLENRQAANASCAGTMQTVLECGVDPTIRDIHGNTCLDGADEDTVRCVLSYTMRYRPDVMSRPGVIEWFESLLPTDTSN